MKKFLIAVALVIGCGLFLGGCASLAGTRSANLTVINVRPANSTLLETGLELTLRIINESNRPLDVTGSSHRLAFNGTSVGRAVSDEAVTVPPLGTTTVNVTVYVENLTLLRKLAAQQSLENVAYRLESRVFVSGSGTLRIVNEGSLNEFASALRR